MRLMVTAVAVLALSLNAVPTSARNHGTTPGLEGAAHGKAENPPESRKISPGENNPTTAPVAPIGDNGPVPDAPGLNETAPGQLCAELQIPEEVLACELDSQ
jgi:hypothetical protein